MGNGDFVPSKEGRQAIENFMSRALRKQPTFKHAYKNPDFIEDITRDKWLQEQYIPAENLPRTWHENEPPLSSTGFWVVKPRHSRGGDGIYILSDQEFEEALADINFIAEYVAQEFLPSSGAQMDTSGNPASMRLLVDFTYLKNGDVVTDFSTAYQRVSPYSGDDTKTPSGEDLYAEDVFIVNRNRGANSVVVSQEELKLAREVSEKIIRNIADAYIKKHEVT